MRQQYYENPRQYYKELAVREAIKSNCGIFRRGLKIYLVKSDMNELNIVDMTNESREFLVDSNDLFSVLWKKAYLNLVSNR